MNIDKQTTPQAALQELTTRLTRFRIDSGITQNELARQAGLGKRTVERIENGANLQLTTLVRLLRVLGLADRLDQLIPEQMVSPIDMLGDKTEPAKRARSRKEAKTEGQWKWGDEQ